MFISITDIYEIIFIKTFILHAIIIILKYWVTYTNFNFLNTRKIIDFSLLIALY